MALDLTGEEEDDHTNSLLQRRQKRAEKEINESVILVEYLISNNLSFDDIKNFTSKAVKAALIWKETN